MDYQKAENEAREVKEAETALLRLKVQIAAEWVSANAARALADMWGRSTAYINTLARMTAFPEEDINPVVPITLYSAALDAAAEDGRPPAEWLDEAIAQGWSSRQLRDAADVKKGRRVSRVTFHGRGPVEVWDVGAGRFTCSGLPLSGNSPVVADVMIREVIDGSGTAKTNP